MDIKAVRKGMREINKLNYPYRNEYNYGFHDAVEVCNKLIEKQIQKYNRAKRKEKRKERGNALPFNVTT